MLACFDVLLKNSFNVFNQEFDFPPWCYIQLLSNMKTMAKPCHYRVSVKALIENQDQRILLFKESSGLWEIPGGGWEHNEGIEECLQREIMEEAGLQIQLIDTSPAYILQAKNPEGLPIVNIIFKATLTSNRYTPTAECIEMTYFSPLEMKSLRAFDNVHAFADFLINLRLNHTS